MKIPVLICVISACAFGQSVTIAPPLFSGSGLNDASSAGTFSRLPTNAYYVLAISATGTPDHFTWSKNGGTASAPIAITGGTCLAGGLGTGWQNITDGVKACWLASTGHTLGNWWVITANASGSARSVNTIQSGVGAGMRTQEAKNRDTFNALDYGADPTGVADSTAAIQNGISAATTQGACLRIPGGLYKLTNASGLASITLTDHSCIYGDGSAKTALLQATNGGASIGVTGYSASIENLFVGKAAGVTGGKGIVLYPDNTSTAQVAYARINAVEVGAAFCPTLDSSCMTAANSNRLDYGILGQSGVKDTLFNWITNSKVRWADKAIEFISGGLAGSASVGAAQANWIENNYISDVGNCIAFISSGENFFHNTQCTNSLRPAFLFGPQTTGFYTGFQASGNAGSLIGEADINGLVDFGNLTDYTSSQASQANIIEVPVGEIFAGLSGNISILGSAQHLNHVKTPGTLKTSFYRNKGVISGTYVSGGSIVGSAGGACSVAFSGGVNGTATVGLTGTNTIAGGTSLNIVTTGTYSSAPTTAILTSNAGGTCSGTATVSTVIAETSVDPFLCAGLIDDYNSPCTATVDFRSSANITNLLRFRKGQNVSSVNDFVNWDPFAGGYISRLDPSYSYTSPHSTYESFNAGSDNNHNIFSKWRNSGVDVAQFGGRYFNSAVSAVTEAYLSAYDSGGSATYPFHARGDGLIGPGIEITVTQLSSIGCVSTLPPTGTMHMEVPISDLFNPVLGGVPVGGGGVHGKVYCDGANWTVAAPVQAGLANAITKLTGDVTATGPGIVAATLSNTGAAAGTYGDATHVPVFAVDLKGRISAVSPVTITFPSGATVTDSFLTGCSLSTATATACTNAGCTTTTPVVASVTLSCTGASAAYTNGLHQ